jgi:hypothetical protein
MFVTDGARFYSTCTTTAHAELEYFLQGVLALQWGIYSKYLYIYSIPRCFYRYTVKINRICRWQWQYEYTITISKEKEKAKAKAMGLVSRRRKKGVNVVRFQMASTSHGAGDTHNVIKVLIGVCCS